MTVRHSPVIEAAFLRRLLEDRDAGRELSLHQYQACYPGYEELVAEQYALASGDHDDDARRIGRFELIRELGSGGQGSVYEAVDPTLRRRVAVKVLTGLGGASPTVLARFRREAEMASRLEHPGICTVYEADVDGPTPYLAMRLVEGETLAAAIRRAKEEGSDRDRDEARLAAPRDRDGLARLLRYFARAAEALEAAHAEGVIHRDIKPGNLMITPDGRPVILDFGLAAALEGELPTLTRTGDVFGTPAYMAPEQIEPSRGPVDARSDVHALAVSLFEALTLRLPFGGVSRESLFRAILSRDSTDVRSLNPELPDDLSVVLQTALQKSGEHRYRSAALFAADLRAVADLRPILARPTPPLTRLARWARREPGKARLLGAVIVLLVALLTAGGYLGARWTDFRVAETERAEQARAHEVERMLEEGFFELEEQRDLDAVRIFADADRLAEGGSIEAVVGQVIGLSRAGRLDEAARVLEVDDREHPALIRCRAAILERQGRPEEARALRDRLGEPETAAECLVAAMARMSSGQHEQEDYRVALELLTRAVFLLDRPRALYHLERCRAAMVTGDLPAQLDSTAALRAHSPDNPIVLVTLARAALGVGEPESARDLAKQCIAEVPDYHVAWQVLGQALTKLGDLDGAEEAVSTAIDLRPDWAASHAVRSHIRILKNDYDGAESDADHALERSPELGHARYCKGVILLRRGEYEDALRELRAAQFPRPDPERLVNVGECFFKLGQPDEALARFEEALAIRPDMASANTGVAIVAASRGDLTAAIEAFRRIQAVRPDDLVVHRNLGTALAQSGRFVELRDLMADWVERHPDSLAHHAELARMMHGPAARPDLRDDERAREHARAALELLAAIDGADPELETEMSAVLDALQ